MRRSRSVRRSSGFRRRYSSPRRRSQPSLMHGLAVAAIFACAAASLAMEFRPSLFLSPVDETQPQLVARAPLPTFRETLPLPARHLPVCRGFKRIDCVVDGDTFWVAGEKIRIADIDAPEVQGDCARERDLADRATQRLSEVLSSGPLSIRRQGEDRYGRTLATVRAGETEVGRALVHEGLAQRWIGRKAQWCG